VLITEGSMSVKKRCDGPETGGASENLVNWTAFA